VFDETLRRDRYTPQRYDTGSHIAAARAQTRLPGLQPEDVQRLIFRRLLQNAGDGQVWSMRVFLLKAAQEAAQNAQTPEKEEPPKRSLAFPISNRRSPPY
jgi:hypothetical protein